MKKIGLLVGSLRKESFSKKIALQLREFIPEAYAVEFIDIGHLPFYNQDFDDYDNVPSSYEEFRQKVKEMDGFIFVTPEYNRSVPAVLKNALDVASRPPADNRWSDKPALVISQSPGRIGGFGANHHLRQSLSCLNVHTLAHPEVYLSNSSSFLDEAGNITNEATTKFLQSVVEKFIKYAEKLD